jgi:hypothetical protein
MLPVDELTAQDTQWKDTSERLAETAPAQTWAPILSALYTAEVECVTEEMERLYGDEINQPDSSNPGRHFTDSKVLIVHAKMEELLAQKTDQYGTNAQSFHLTEKLINQWTTLPLPTTETWINATEQDQDLRRTRQLQQKVVPLSLRATILAA